MPARTRATTNGVDHMEDAHTPIPEMEEAPMPPNRLILCFDGTGNSFMGNTADTNIVKLYDKFNRSHPHQMHYYQPGIGTYSGDGSSVNASWWGKLKQSISQTIDEGVATTFDSHVIAGYRFLMRYYGEGDRIYIFGFSRGAFTARFLARMISQVGLLSRGNEEMVPFAYKIYQDYEMGAYEDYKARKKVEQSGGDWNPEDHPNPKITYIKNFKRTFCRHEHLKGEAHSEVESGIKVHFLGLFDTVSSVGTFDVPFTKQVMLPQVGGTAEHVRHAVAIDERRVKFKAALLAQEKKGKGHQTEDIKEVWFPGNHGDVGGGWPAGDPEKAQKKQTVWQKIVRVFTNEKDTEPSPDVSQDLFQQSDIALKWMIDELEGITSDQIAWDTDRKKEFMDCFELNRKIAVSSQLHDTMRYGGGSSPGKVFFWNFLEHFPFIKRWEYVKGIWDYVTFPLNKGATRDIPPGAVFHHSLLERMQASQTYRPKNHVWFYPFNKDDPQNNVKYDVHKHLHDVDADFVSAGERSPLLKKKPGTRFVAVEPRREVESDNVYRIEVV
ncbi:hypothetical protein MMC30_000767 [Trapelia coarctata]|nr:hypothetical protein [Trapelia coarctata]